MLKGCVYQGTKPARPCISVYVLRISVNKLSCRVQSYAYRLPGIGQQEIISHRHSPISFISILPSDTVQLCIHGLRLSIRKKIDLHKMIFGLFCTIWQRYGGIKPRALSGHNSWKSVDFLGRTETCVSLYHAISSQRLRIMEPCNPCKLKLKLDLSKIQ